MARDYKHEYAAYHGKPEQIAKRAQRNAARREVENKVGSAAIKGKDVDHGNPIRKGGTNAPGNLKVKSPSANRSWRRGKTGYD